VSKINNVLSEAILSEAIQEENIKLRSENERLRTVIELFAEYYDLDTDNDGYHQIPKLKIKIAKQALEGNNER
jgi:hypothetical protein